MNEVKSELAVAGNNYRVGKLNCIAQFHVARRLGPMLVVAGISVEMLRKGWKMELDDMVAMAGPVMQFLAKMSDEDVDYCMYNCLAVVQRQQQGAWAPVIASVEAKTFMFEDIDMPSMVRLVLEVLKANLGNFLEELGEELTSPSSSNASQPQAGAGGQ